MVISILLLFYYFILFYFILFYFILFYFILFYFIIYFVPKEQLTCLRKGFMCWAGLHLQGQRPLLAVEPSDLQTLLFLLMEVSKEVTLHEQH